MTGNRPKADLTRFVKHNTRTAARSGIEGGVEEEGVRIPVTLGRRVAKSEIGMVECVWRHATPSTHMTKKSSEDFAEQ